MTEQYAREKLAESKMFYVIYSQTEKLYLDDEGLLGDFAGATQYASREDALSDLNTLDSCFNFKVVGPCIEGEQP